MLSPRTEEVLSYFQGLAPRGETFEVPQEWLGDIGMGCRQVFYRHLNKIINRGYVKRRGTGYRRSTGVLEVVRRLEDA